MVATVRLAKDAGEEVDPPVASTDPSSPRRWNVSKSEALRRAIRAAEQSLPAEQCPALDALEQLQGSLALTPESARRWEARVRSERRASGRR